MARFRRLFRFPSRTPQQIHREVDEELRFHLEMRMQELVDSGLSPDEAAAEARRQFGSVDDTRSSCAALDARTERTSRVRMFLAEGVSDLRLAWRKLWRYPGSSVAAIGTLALGFGTAAVVISVVRFIAFQPSGIVDPEGTAFLFSRDERRPVTRIGVSFADFVDWRDAASSFTELAAFQTGTRTLTGAGNPRRVSALIGTPNLMATLGLQPATGRALSADAGDDAGGIVVVSHRFWQEALDGRDAIIGDAVRLDGTPHTVVGVLPETVRFGDFGAADVWVPLDARTASTAPRDDRSFAVVGRLRAEISAEEASAELDVVARQLADDHPVTNRGWGVTVVSGSDALLTPPARALLAIMSALALAVLLVASCNVAGLLLAGAPVRRKEAAIRGALGAGRSRLVRQFLIEGVVLAVLAAIIGVGIAMGGLQVAKLSAQATNPLFAQMTLDRWVLLATAIAAVLTPLVFALVPGWLTARGNLGATLNASSVTQHYGPRGKRGHRLLIAAELAVALVLVVVVALFLQTGWAFQRIPTGLVPDGLLTARIDLPAQAYDNSTAQITFFQEVVDRVGRLPGVRAVGVGSFVPVADREPTRPLEIEGRVIADENRGWAAVAAVSAGYRAALGIPLRSGRDLAGHEVETARAVALINDTMAGQFWSQASPLGSRIRLGTSPDATPWLTIIGVVADVRNSDIDQPTQPHVYLPFTAAPAGTMALFVRSEGDPLRLVPDVRRAVSSVDPNQPLYDVRSMPQVLADDLAEGVFLITLLGVLALVAIGLAASGVYAVLSYVVGQRTSELGVRMALGASSRRVVGLVVGDGLRYGVVGVLLGVLGAWGAAGVIADQLYGVTATDPVTFVGSVAIVLAVVVAASWLPARAAVRLSPLTAIRRE